MAKKFPKIIFNRRLQYKKNMTICVAAIAEIFEDEPRIVFCADRLVSGQVQFEHGNSKISRLGDNCIIMMAGNPLKGAEIINRTIIQIKTNPHSIPDIVQIISKEYQKMVNETNEQIILSTRKMTIEEFYSKSNEMSEELVNKIDDELNHNPFELSFIICGIDNGEAHLYEVTDKGEINNYDSIGFVAIGSGAPQSIAELGKYQYGSNISLSQAIHLTYLAKKEAQRVGTVGDETDLGVIHNVDGQTALWMADKDFFGMLDQQIDKLKGYERQLQTETEGVISKRLYKQKEHSDKIPDELSN